MLMTPALCAQQSSDNEFSFQNAAPLYPPDTGPIVCIDSAHYNYHTATGRYKPFADLISGDGFQVQSLQALFTLDALADCTVLVVANALSEQNRNDWSYPHNSAFTRGEIDALQQWVRNGGNMLLIADHAPFAGAAADLAAVFALLMQDVYSVQAPGETDIFSTEQNTLGEHPILAGRDNAESINRLATFTGQPFRTLGNWQPLLIFGPGSLAYINPQQSFQEQNAAIDAFSVNGWTHAAARELQQGRLVVLGEAAMCSAQIAANGIAMGMNHPEAGQNAQFCLNIIRWLSRAIN